jgi:hypothetical protein
VVIVLFVALGWCLGQAWRLRAWWLPFALARLALAAWAHHGQALGVLVLLPAALLALWWWPPCIFGADGEAGSPRPVAGRRRASSPPAA